MSFDPFPDFGRGADEAATLAGIKAFKTPLPEYLGAQVREGFWASIPGQAIAQTNRMAAEVEGETPLTAEEWRASPSFRPTIPFDEKMTPSRARATAETFDENAYRRWLIDQRKAGALDGTLGFIAGMAGSAPDPVNFIPWAGPAFRAARIARYGQIGGRAAAGAFEGAVGTAVAQPFLVTSRNQFGDDVGFADVTMDIAFGAFAGAAIGGGAGLWKRFRGGPDDLKVTPRETAADPIPDIPRQNAALHTLDTAARDVATGRAIDIDPRVAAEMAGVRQAYDDVRRAPAGPANDPLVQITPADIEATAIARGGWKDIGEAEVKGSGSGLVKIIWRHGEESAKPPAERVTRADVVALPEVVRELEAGPGAKGANRMWVRQREDGQHVVYVDGPTDDGRRVLSIFVAKDKAAYPLSPKMGEGGSPGRVRSPAGDTAREPLGRPPESRDPNMPQTARPVNFDTAAPDRAPDPAEPPAKASDSARTDAAESAAADLDRADELVAAGRLTEADAATIKAARAELARTEAYDKAAPAAALCFRG